MRIFNYYYFELFAQLMSAAVTWCRWCRNYYTSYYYYYYGAGLRAKKPSRFKTILISKIIIIIIIIIIVIIQPTIAVYYFDGSYVTRYPIEDWRFTSFLQLLFRNRSRTMECLCVACMHTLIPAKTYARVQWATEIL